VSNNQDPARAIAERVARRLAGIPTPLQPTPTPLASHGGDQPSRARLINFISPNPPARIEPSIVLQQQTQSKKVEPESSGRRQVAQSPWLAPFARGQQEYNPQSSNRAPQSADHPSQERFGVEEAAVSELVEFFENEKQCAVDPSGKPCDHCAMCSSRGF